MRRAVGVLFLLLGVLALVLWRFPLERVVRTQVPGLEAESVTGTIWSGRLRGARYQGLALGDVDVGLIPGTLLSGTPQLRFARLQGPISGRALLSTRMRRVEGVSGRMDLPLGQSGIAARIEVSGLSLETDLRGHCRAVDGAVQATLTGLPLIGTSPALAGAPACDGPGIRVPLQLADGNLGLDFGVQPDRRWQAELWLRAGNPLLRTLLATAGFALAADYATLSVSGNLGDLSPA